MSTGRQLYNTSSAAAAWRYQRRQYLKLLHQKSSEFWTTRIDAEQSQPRRLWRSFDQLLGRCRASPSTDLDATQLHRFFQRQGRGCTRRHCRRRSTDIHCQAVELRVPDVHAGDTSRRGRAREAAA